MIIIIAYDEHVVNQVVNAKSDMKVSVYLQSFKYFVKDFASNDDDELAKLFKFRDSTITAMIRLRDVIKAKYRKNSNEPVLVGIHIRRSMLICVNILVISHIE